MFWKTERVWLNNMIAINSIWSHCLLYLHASFTYSSTAIVESTGIGRMLGGVKGPKSAKHPATTGIFLPSVEIAFERENYPSIFFLFTFPNFAVSESFEKNFKFWSFSKKIILSAFHVAFATFPSTYKILFFKNLPRNSTISFAW